MKKKIILILVLFASLFRLIGCGKSNEIQGTVRDIFGNPLSDVLVKVKKSTFSSKSDDSGNYSIDYAPGKIHLDFSKKGYTTHRLILNIQEKAYFPAKTIIMYPIPQEKGLYFIDTENKRLVRLKKTGKTIVKTKYLKNYYYDYTRYRSYIKSNNISLPIIKHGKVMFIDKIPSEIYLTKLRYNGLCSERIYNMMGMMNDTFKYSGFIKESSIKIGKEKLLVRSFNLQPGSYAWVQAIKDGNYYPTKSGVNFEFKVGRKTKE